MPAVSATASEVNTALEAIIGKQPLLVMPSETSSGGTANVGILNKVNVILASESNTGNTVNIFKLSLLTIATELNQAKSKYNKPFKRYYGEHTIQLPSEILVKLN